jgi:hypothetical protein
LKSSSSDPIPEYPTIVNSCGTEFGSLSVELRLLAGGRAGLVDLVRLDGVDVDSGREVVKLE